MPLLDEIRLSFRILLHDHNLEVRTTDVKTERFEVTVLSESLMSDVACSRRVLNPSTTLVGTQDCNDIDVSLELESGTLSA